MSECKICGRETDVIFNIRFKAVHICDYCALSITNQNVSALCIEKVKLLKEVVNKD
jgi:ribosome-binding protein aMBF1 (putative translation factor)